VSEQHFRPLAVHLAPLPADGLAEQGLTVWEPVTADTDYGRWLAAPSSDTTLITQFEGDEPD
jgi:hypothetical protein